jgi:signal transduction histidine kinase
VALTGVQLVREAELSRQRTAFIAGVSHELRTPLTQIRMFAETLALGRVRSGAERHQSVEVIARESLRLSQLVDKVLSFTSTGRREALERRHVDLSTLVREATTGFAPVAEARDSTIQLAVAPGLHVHGDAAALRQVVINLLDNAVKYGRPGQTVIVSAGRAAEGIRLAVQDEGPGVPEADRARIWEPFWRAAGSEQGGSGLGLAIVEQVVTLHGGTVAVDNAPGGGARFSVLLVPADAPAADVELRPAGHVA